MYTGPLKKLFKKNRIKSALKLVGELNESDWMHYEGVYRCYHGSYKIYHMKELAAHCLFMSLRMLNLIEFADDFSIEPRKLKRYIKKDTMTWWILDKMRKDNLPKSRTWINIEKQMIPYCGYFHFFKTILESLLICSIRKDRNMKTKECGFMPFDEGVVRYFIGDLNLDSKRNISIS